MVNSVIGLDIGTTDCKAVALDERGEVIASHQERYALHTPRPGWAEQDCNEIWQAVVKALAQLAPDVSTTTILGIGLSGAMHSLIMIDGHDEPLAPAMTWADQRASDIARSLSQQTNAIALYQRTGCPLQPTYHPARARWCVDVAGIKFARLVSIKEFVLHRLIGAWAIDLGLASTTGLLDIHTRRWDAEALSLASIGEAQLSPLVSGLSNVGTINQESARLTGLASGLPVVVGGSDGGMAMVGVPERTVITVGTSGAIRRIATSPLLDPQARTWCYVQENAAGQTRWLVGGAINNGGLAAQWAKEKFYPHEEFETMFQEVSDIAAGSSGVLCLPYFAGERSPYWSTNLRATLSGMGLEHSRAHLARAVLEGVAYCLTDVWEILGTIDNAADTHNEGSDKNVRLSGGITRSPVWSQIVCDALGVPLRLVGGADASATGAALTVSMAFGQSIILHEGSSITLSPDQQRHDLYQELHKDFQRRGMRELHAND